MGATMKKMALAWAGMLVPPAAAGGWFYMVAEERMPAELRLTVLCAGLATAILVYLVLDGEGRRVPVCGGIYTAALMLCAGAMWLETVLPADVMGLARFARAVSGAGTVDALLVAGPFVALLPVSYLWLDFVGKFGGAERDKRKRASSELFGKSKLLSREHMRILERRQGILLGQSGPRSGAALVGWGLEGSAITLAPPRTGKGATIALNYLAPRGRGWPGSTVLIDPRGETWCVVSRRRREMGRRTVLLDPFGVVKGHKKAAKKEELHLPFVESRKFNPMDFIRKDEALAPRDINVLLDAILTPPKGTNDSSSHFYESARAIISGYIAWVKFKKSGSDCTLQEVYRLLTLPEEERDALVEVMRKEAAFAGGLTHVAAERQSQVGQQEAGSNFSTIANQLAWLNYPEMAEHTGSSDFDPMELAEGDMDLFVVVPEEMTDHVKAWVRLWVTIPNGVSGMTALKRDMLIVIDEMPKLGFLKPVMDAYTMAAGRGVHFWCFAGSVSALDAGWGRENREVLIQLAEVLQVLGFPRVDVNGAETLSLAIGSASFEARAESHSGRNAGPGVVAGGTLVQDGQNVTVVKERVVMPDDIMTMGPDQQFVVAAAKDMPRDAFGLNHARYWERPDSRDLADPNPLVVRKRAAVGSGSRFGMFGNTGRGAHVTDEDVIQQGDE